MRITEKTFGEVIDQLQGKPDDERDPIVWGLVEEVVALREEIKDLAGQVNGFEEVLRGLLRNIRRGLLRRRSSNISEAEGSRNELKEKASDSWRERALAAEEALRSHGHIGGKR